MIKIDDKFFIDADSNSYTLKEKDKIQDKKSKNYGEEVLNYSTDKLKEFLSFFKEQNYEKIKGAFLINHDDFIDRCHSCTLQ